MACSCWFPVSHYAALPSFVIMFGLCGPNILIFLWISMFLIFYVRALFLSIVVFIQSTLNLGTMILRYWGLLVWFVFKNSQLFFRICLGFSTSLCVDRCWLNDGHVGWFSIHCLNENGRMSRVPLCGDRIHPLVSTFHNGNTFIQWCFNFGQCGRRWHNIKPTLGDCYRH